MDDFEIISARQNEATNVDIYTEWANNSLRVFRHKNRTSGIIVVPECFIRQLREGPYPSMRFAEKPENWRPYAHIKFHKHLPIMVLEMTDVPGMGVFTISEHGREISSVDIGKRFSAMIEDERYEFKHLVSPKHDEHWFIIPEELR